jgi:hypothetical protein
MRCVPCAATICALSDIPDTDAGAGDGTDPAAGTDGRVCVGDGGDTGIDTAHTAHTGNTGRDDTYTYGGGVGGVGGGARCLLLDPTIGEEGAAVAQVCHMYMHIQ